MKLDVAVNEITLSNVGTAGEFRIRNSAKAFKILSDGLYSNKIRAIIRELSCNALDSHVGAGKADVPFEVHLPSMLEPWFSVKDFGLGLSGDQVMNIYTTYFESTKTESNDFVGALGLGSKSPFSYTENFTVTAIKDGIKRIYSAFINEVGVPSVVEMNKESTDEGNGVEVKFSVTDRYDYQSFRNESAHVFMWFKNRPVITGNDEFIFVEPDYKEQNIVPGVHSMRDSYHGSYAVMGNIAYPLGKISEPEKHFGSLAKLLNCNLVLEFEIGELDFAASREELSYVPLTLNSIKRKLVELNDNLTKHFAGRADAITCKWQRAQYIYEQASSKLFSAAVEQYVCDTKFPLYDSTKYYGKKEFEFKVSDLETRDLEIKGFRYSNGICNRVSENSKYVAHTPSTGSQCEKVMSIPVEMDIVIVLNDIKTGCVSRARYHFAHHNGNKRALVFCVSHKSPDLLSRNLEYNKLLTELHNPPTVVKASELQKPARQKSTKSLGIMSIVVRSSHDRGNKSAYKWVAFDEEIDEDETYYYVQLNNHQAVDERGQEVDIFGIRAMMDRCGIAAIEKIKILGVRKNALKEIIAQDNWVRYEDKLKEEALKITNDHVASLVASEMLDSYYNKVYISHNLAKLVGPNSYYAQYVEKMAKIKRASGDVSNLVAICTKYGNVVQVDAVKQQISNLRDSLYKKYPLIKHLHTANERDVAQYINMIDKLEIENE
jgi:hypothetical protein